MSLLNSRGKQRGNISLFALITISVLIGSALSQTAFVTMLIKGNQAVWIGMEKDDLILNSAQRIIQSRDPGEGTLHHQGHLLEYEHLESQGTYFRAQRILVDIDQEPYWPQIVFFQIETPNETLTLTDYWRP